MPRYQASDADRRYRCIPSWCVVERRHLRKSSIADISKLSSFGDKRILLVFNDIGNIMQVRTPLDLGLAIRDRRRRLKLSQAELARNVGVGRQWVVAIEHGKSVPSLV